MRRDPDHEAAIEWMRRNRHPLVTTDHVIDELLTLPKIRESHRLAAAAGEALFQQNVARVARIAETDFLAAWEAFRRYRDKGWSFTDCTSKAIMERLGITHAFAFDTDFEEFGTITRVP